MARRSLSDQRHLLVELELDEGVLLRPHHHHQYDDNTSRRRPSQVATLRRTSVDHLQKTPSPYKLKQKVLSSRSRQSVDSNDGAIEDTSWRPPPARRHEVAPSESPLLLIADAIRDNVSQRSRVLLDTQDELRRLPAPRQRSGNRPGSASGTEPPLLSTKAVKLLNRLRSLTLSVIEMVRYFYEQLTSASSSAALRGDTAWVWALQLECQETLARLCASDVDVLLASPCFALFYESLGVSALRNPLLDGVALDSSELLLCSCQAMGTRGSAMASSSLFQLVVARLEAFAVQVRRQYPAWQLLPHDRVAHALLDLLESENKANATRMLPSYLRPDANTRRYTPLAVSAPRHVDVSDSEEDDAESNGVAAAVAPMKSQAWVEAAPIQPSNDPPRRTSRVQMHPESLEPPRAQPPAPATMKSFDSELVAPVTAEPKALPPETAKHQAAKKAKKLQERSATLSSLGLPKTPAPATANGRAETKDPFQFAIERHAEATREEQRTLETIASALDKLPQFSLESLGIAVPPKQLLEPAQPTAPEELESSAPVADSGDPIEVPVASESDPLEGDTEEGIALLEVPATSPPSLPSMSPRQSLPSLPALPSPRVREEEEELASPNVSELSRIMALCRDVQVAAMDLGERLHPLRFDAPAVETPSHSYSPRYPSAIWAPPPPRSPTLTLSSRFLERELKMLRRCFRLWAAARAQRHARLVDLRDASAARRIGRLGRHILCQNRERERLLEHARREQLATRIQRRWRLWLARQCARRRQREFHLVARYFQRCRFFTHVTQRRRRHDRACGLLQRWWRRSLRRWHAAEQRRLAAERESERRASAARHLQAFVRERTLRRRLAEAEEANRRIHMKQNLVAMKARQDETKRRQLEAKRLAEPRVAMQLSLREMEAKWKTAEAETLRCQEEQAQRDLAAQREADARKAKHARETIDRFLERSMLRRRLRAALDATAAIAEAKRALEFVRGRLERQHRADQARRLLLGRMLWWKVAKTQCQAKCDANDALWRQQRQRARERDEWNQKLQAQLRARVVESHVLEYCGVATRRVVASAFDARLAAKREEAQRLRRQAARERVASFVQRHWLAWRLAEAQREAEKRRREQDEATERERHAQVQREAQRLRDHSEHVVGQWISHQVARAREKQAVETVRREAEAVMQRETQRREEAEREAARLRVEKEQLQQQHRRREQLVELQRRKSQIKAQQLAEKHDRRREEEASPRSERVSEKQHAELLAQLQRHQQERCEREAQLQWERQARAWLVDVVVDTQRLAQGAATAAVSAALCGVHARCESLTLAARYHHVMARAWQHEVCWRWRQFVRRRRGLAALATHMLWPQASPPQEDITALPRQHQEQIELRDERLAELRRIAAVRRVQRGWHASRKRIRQARRLEVKRAEDALVARAKRRGSAICDHQLVATASAARTLTRWAHGVARRCQLRYTFGTHALTFVLSFSGGRAWATTTLETETTRLRFDRAVTRRLLQGVDPAVHVRDDLDRLLRELGSDLTPIVATAKTSPRAMTTPDGVLELGDVDEIELPRLALVTRQLSKTRSMAKRKQLLDAKQSVDTSDGPRGLTIFDAVESASQEDAQFLLLQGENLHAREPCHQRTALHMLAFSSKSVAQRVALLRFLVERAKLDLHARDDSGATPLMTFATHGCLALLDASLQLARLPELCRETDHDGRTAFHCACSHDQPECAAAIQQFVLTKTSPTSEATLRELYAADKRGATPLHVLAELGHRECLRAVLTPLDGHSKKALIDQLDDNGCTPLHLAVAHEHIDVVQELLAAGGSVDMGDVWQRRPLHYATRVAASAATALTSLLTDHAALLDAADVRGDTALHWAAGSGRAHVVHQLLLLGADPHVLNSDWETPASMAAANRHAECVRLLLPASASVGDLRGTAGHHHDAQDVASASSYYYLPSTTATGTTAGAAAVVRKGGEIDWDELQQGVELVEESGHFSSEDERDEDDTSRWYSDEDEP